MQPYDHTGLKSDPTTDAAADDRTCRETLAAVAGAVLLDDSQQGGGA